MTIVLLSSSQRRRFGPPITWMCLFSAWSGWPWIQRSPTRRCWCRQEVTNAWGFGRGRKEKRGCWEQWKWLDSLPDSQASFWQWSKTPHTWPQLQVDEVNMLLGGCVLVLMTLDAPARIETDWNVCRPLVALESHSIAVWQLSEMAEDICSEPHDLLRGHSGGVTCLAFSPEGGRLLSGGKDKVRVLTESQVVYRAAGFPQEMWAKHVMILFSWRNLDVKFFFSDTVVWDDKCTILSAFNRQVFMFYIVLFCSVLVR